MLPKTDVSFDRLVMAPIFTSCRLEPSQSSARVTRPFCGTSSLDLSAAKLTAISLSSLRAMMYLLANARGNQAVNPFGTIAVRVAHKTLELIALPIGWGFQYVSERHSHSSGPKR